MDQFSRKPCSCLLVEDLPATASWLEKLVLETFPSIEITTCSSLGEARTTIKKQRFELALIDLGLPDGNGTDLISQLGRDQPSCLKIVTTIYTDDHHVFPALRAGAQGYLLKDQAAHKVGQALLGITLGEPPLSPAIAQRLMRVFSAQADDDQINNRLSPRELQTLGFIAKGLKISEVSEQLGVTSNTAAGYVKSIYRKLNINNRSEATIEAVRLGLIKTEI